MLAVVADRPTRSLPVANSTPGARDGKGGRNHHGGKASNGAKSQYRFAHVRDDGRSGLLGPPPVFPGALGPVRLGRPPVFGHGTRLRVWARTSPQTGRMRQPGVRRRAVASSTGNSGTRPQRVPPFLAAPTTSQGGRSARGPEQAGAAAPGGPVHRDCKNVPAGGPGYAGTGRPLNRRAAPRPTHVVAGWIPDHH